MWGIVFVEASSVGFAMEFIGDMADSTVGGNIKFLKHTLDPLSPPASAVSIQPPGRGIN